MTDRAGSDTERLPGELAGTALAVVLVILICGSVLWIAVR